MAGIATASRGRLIRRDHIGRYGKPWTDMSCVVCVPVKNEVRRLPAFLRAMSRAFRAISDIRGKLVIALDGCTDGSEAVIEARRSGFPVEIETIVLVPYPVPHAGRARRAAMNQGAECFPNDDVVLFTTDADTLVDEFWLLNTLKLMSFTDLVCGDIWRDDYFGNVIRTPHEDYLHDLHRLRRTLDPVSHDSHDPHPCVTGASLALRRDVYGAVGGCPFIHNREDKRLVTLVRNAGYRVRQDRSVNAVTSSRRTGRADGGLSEILKRQDNIVGKGRPVLAVDPRRYVDLFHYSAELRRGFARDDAGRTEKAADSLRLSRDRVRTAWKTARSADAFVSTLVDEPVPKPEISLERARHLLSDLRSPLRLEIA